MLGQQRGAVIVIAGIRRLDAGIGLRWQRADYIGELHISQPCHPVIGGLARPHPVTGHSRISAGATGALAPVIPCSKDGAVLANGEIGLPLGARGRIGV